MNIDYIIAQIKNNKFTELILDDNNIILSTIIKLCDALKTNTSIKVVQLTNNYINDISAKYISDLLKINKTINKIYLDYNNLYENNDMGIKWITEALKINKTINTLSLCNNKIGSSGVKYICELLKMNNTLNICYLENNQISVDDGICISNVLQENTSITVLYISEQSDICLPITEIDLIIHRICIRNRNNMYQKGVTLRSLSNAKELTDN